MSGRGAVRVIDDPTELLRFRSDWNQLRADMVAPFIDLDYVVAHAEVLSGRDRPFLLSYFEGERLTAVAPLVCRGSSPKRLYWLDTSSLSSALYLDRRRLVRLVDAIYALRLPLAIQALDPGSPTERTLRARRPRGWLTLKRSWLAAPSLALDPDAPDPVMALSKNRRSQLRRKLRRAKEMGEVHFDVLTTPEDLAGNFTEFVRIEASGWKGRAGTALAYDREQREGLWRYLSAPAVSGSVRVTRMRIGDKTAAIHLAVARGGRLWSFKTAIDEDFKQFMPGFHLYAFSIQAAAEEGLEFYEFMGETEPIKELWGAAPSEGHRRRFYPPTLGGGMALTKELVQKGLRQAFA